MSSTLTVSLAALTARLCASTPITSCSLTTGENPILDIIPGRAWALRRLSGVCACGCSASTLGAPDAVATDLMTATGMEQLRLASPACAPLSHHSTRAVVSTQWPSLQPAALRAAPRWPSLCSSAGLTTANCCSPGASTGRPACVKLGASNTTDMARDGRWGRPCARREALVGSRPEQTPFGAVRVSRVHATTSERRRRLEGRVWCRQWQLDVEEGGRGGARASCGSVRECDRRISIARRSGVRVSGVAAHGATGSRAPRR